MTSSDDPRPARAQGWAVIGLLVAAGLLSMAVIAIGLGGALGPRSSPTASPAASASVAPTHSPGRSPAASVGPTETATTSTPPASPTLDALVAGLLTDADLPRMSSPLGVQEGTDYDIDDAAFEANEGIRVVSRTWQSLADTGLAAVFDFRMQFPTDAAAAGYLDAAERVLSEAEATGQSPVPSPPVIGSDSRVYGLETTGEGGTVLLRTYLFQVGPVIAKVVAGGPGVTAATTDRIARAAAARMTAAGPPVPGSPRPPASPGPTPAASEPLPTGEALAALLLEHVPLDIGPGCVPDEQRLWDGELATLVCTDEASGVTVTYSGFESVEALEAAFDSSLGTIDLSGVAASCDLGPFLGDYQVEDEQVGQLACWPEQGGQAIMWSDDRLAILAVAASPTLDAAGLYLWWLEAGPVL